jgi:hypothetical protein
VLQDLGPYSQWWWENTRIATDAIPGLGPCAVRWLGRYFVKGGSPAVYTYLFAHPAQVKVGGLQVQSTQTNVRKYRVQ